MGIDERKKQILRAIVLDYIATAEPVGSRTIARKYGLGISPATIRNEMADLEEMGYLEQPHTSAGRIPSQRGYRYYVDELMEPETPAEEEKLIIKTNYQAKVKSISEVIERTGQLMSQLTSYAALVSTPRVTGSTVQHVQLIAMGGGKAMVLVVTEPEKVHTRVIDLPENITAEDLETVSRVMNAKIRGHSLNDIRITILREIYLELLRHKAVVEYIMDLIEDSGESTEDRVYLGGILNILNQPEFRNVEKMKTLLSLLDQEALLSSLLAEQAGQEEGITVLIGDEFKCDLIQGCSLVSARYGVEGRAVGALAVLGPSRMDYARVTGLVEYLTRNLSRVLEKLYR
ncbi:heat-inducible transcriptional repressor HrcA [Candidatus Desulforudis audaxviator]|uniref:Heat-inducible transcription repressor HrcA n=1 Tax=Desulforudis audaxviator (strain MP104C) TaxID=477974 RepID=HRCA_DESAP|nr:heat-inducible transcriptional repressor HrcA [Candidatus Desulforudis audaxviator]B1I6D9.1 RecName: Full=Heat-inducible transcription repressor HrcA [Candidatus Desulforudis audaxviator MP104C]ACA60550.1 heat-inducible transcription repressor HrcA [Candidatus Desulforudis audaxviator MP104C]AZK60621.1 Heat-inducible transcription repressor HrcA [Candidatus Desulforudis audaxviator]